MQKVLLAVAIASLIGCSTQAQKNFDFPEWEPFGYDTLKDKVEGLAGPNAINCGFVDALSFEKSAVKVANQKLGQSQACVDQAIKNKRPFKFGLVRVATTSYVWQLAILTPDDEFWTITYDYAMDQTGTQHFVKRCKGLDIDTKSADLEGKNCIVVSTEEWLAIPPVSAQVSE